MNEMERWIDLDGPEPEALRPLFEALREGAGAAVEADADRMSERLFARLGAMRRGGGGSAEVGEAQGSGASVGAPAREEPARWAALCAEEVEDVEVVGEAGVSAVVATEAMGGVQAASGAGRLAGTAPSLDLPPEARGARGAMPFKSAEEVAAAPDEQKAAKTMQIPVMKGPGDTVGVGDDSIGRAMAAVPFLGNTLGNGVVPIPRLTVAQYASLCVDLSVWPGEEAALLRKYRVVSPVALRALEEHWRERFAGQAEGRVAFEGARETYLAWLRALWGAQGR